MFWRKLPKKSCFSILHTLMRFSPKIIKKYAECMLLVSGPKYDGPHDLLQNLSISMNLWRNKTITTALSSTFFKFVWQRLRFNILKFWLQNEDIAIQTWKRWTWTYMHLYITIIETTTLGIYTWSGMFFFLLLLQKKRKKLRNNKRTERIFFIDSLELG